MADAEDRDSLRIAMISYYLPSGSKIGVGYQVDALARELTARGHHIVVFSDCPPVPDATYEHRHLRMTGHLRTFRFATELRKIDFSGFDVLHAHGDDYWMWRRRVPAHIRTLHGSCFEEAIHIRGGVERVRMIALGFSEVLASVVADRTVVVSPSTRRWTPWVRTVIPNGISAERFHPGTSPRSGAPSILFVGTWAGRKRGELLVEAFRRHVRAQVPDAELWMVSRDVPPAQQRDGVRVLGELSDDQLAEAYRTAWVFCLPSSYEGFGIPYAEAQASGLPVVATPNVGSRFVTDGGRCGVLVEPDQLGEELARLLDDGPRRATLSAAGLERARAFHLATVADQYERLYRQVAASRRRVS